MGGGGKLVQDPFQKLLRPSEGKVADLRVVRGMVFPGTVQPVSPYTVLHCLSMTVLSVYTAMQLYLLARVKAWRQVGHVSQIMTRSVNSSKTGITPPRISKE